MKYFFSSPTDKEKVLFSCGVKNYLLSFAVDGKNCDKFNNEERNIIIDSGAFSVWNKGGTIDIDKYRDFCLSKPQNWTYINLDVIPETGSSPLDIEKCCEKSYENYLYLSQYIKNLMPVYHYGDKISWLKKYMDKTDYIGISPANDTHENVKREFLKSCFSLLNVKESKIKTHGLGYSSFTGLYLFPFYSVDSISFKKIKLYHKGESFTCWANTKMSFIIKKRVKEYMQLEENLTKIWERRGVLWI
jgi:hypothetical protein